MLLLDADIFLFWTLFKQEISKPVFDILVKMHSRRWDQWMHQMMTFRAAILWGKSLTGLCSLITCDVVHSCPVFASDGTWLLLFNPTTNTRSVQPLEDSSLWHPGVLTLQQCRDLTALRATLRPPQVVVWMCWFQTDRRTMRRWRRKNPIMVSDMDHVKNLPDTYSNQNKIKTWIILFFLNVPSGGRRNILLIWPSEWRWRGCLTTFTNLSLVHQCYRKQTDDIIMSRKVECLAGWVEENKTQLFANAALPEQKLT